MIRDTDTMIKIEAVFIVSFCEVDNINNNSH